jgi:large subunit ribosomal protein L21
LAAEAGAKLEFDKVLLIDNGSNVSVGAPAIAGASVTAEVNDHVKGDKVIVFRKKRRKGYKKKNGHRQSFTSITIKDIKA